MSGRKGWVMEEWMDEQMDGEQMEEWMDEQDKGLDHEQMDE